MKSARSNQPNNAAVASVDHLFRHSAGRITAVLVRKFGVEKLDLIEDSIQDAMIKALRTWPFAGVPETPEAWLTTVARNRMIDRLRRENRSESIEELDRSEAAEHQAAFADEIVEDVLRMMFACCSPRISPDSQVALTLRVVGGFNVREIAAAFLSQETAVAKLITRAKKRLRDNDIAIPEPTELKPRLDSVLKVLYLMFNEGYSTTAGPLPVRNDLAAEAIRLAALLSSHPRTESPKVHALMALFCFQTARLMARFDGNGDLLRLSEQDRSKWDRRMIVVGLHHLRKSASGDELSEYHIEAEIASIHTVTERYEDTDWQRLVDRYDALLAIRPSPIAALNRAIASSKIIGADRAIDQIVPLQPALAEYPLFWASLAELKQQAGDPGSADRYFRRAYELCRNESMLRFLRRRFSGENGR